MVSSNAEFFHLQRELSQISQEQKELLEKLRDEVEQKEQLRKLKNEMETERWHLDKTIEKLQKEVRRQEAEQRAGRPRSSFWTQKGALSPSKAWETQHPPKHRCIWTVQIPCSHSLDSGKIPNAEKLSLKKKKL